MDASSSTLPRWPLQRSLDGAARPANQAATQGLGLPESDSGIAQAPYKHKSLFLSYIYKNAEILKLCKADGCELLQDCNHRQLRKSSWRQLLYPTNEHANMANRCLSRLFSKNEVSAEQTSPQPHASSSRRRHVCIITCEIWLNRCSLKERKRSVFICESMFKTEKERKKRS